MNDVIAVDIGNSRITCGLFRQGILLETWHHSTDDANATAQSISSKGSSTVAISSVVPAATAVLRRQLAASNHHLFEIRSQGLVSGTYEGMGVDRQANAVAAWKLYAQELPVLIIDIGTATTLTAVSPDGRFRGGFITLGLSKTLSALHQEAAQLPHVTLDKRSPHPGQLAHDTESAIVQGTVSAHIGLMEHWLRIGRRSLGLKTVAVATGGWSQTLARYTHAFDFVDASLTLKGIYLIAEAEADPEDPGRSISPAPHDTED